MIYYMTKNKHTNPFTKMFCKKSFYSDKKQFIILLTKITAAQNEDVFSYHSVRGLCFLAVIFAATIIVSLYIFLYLGVGY